MSRSSARVPHQRKTTKSARPTLEALEDRCLLTCNIISGFVYQDANNNGIFDFGELPVAGSTIQLRNAANQVVGSTTTNAQGYYEFDHDATLSVAPTSLTKIVTFQRTETDFTLTGQLDRFDPALGELQSIEITHAGAITSEIKVENFSPTSGASISGTVAGSLTLVAPGVNHKLTVSENAGSINLPKFDGVIDFAGTSGASFGVKTASNSAQIILTGNALAPYIGSGQIALQESGAATSNANGGGNQIAQINSTGVATITVIYKYIPSNCLQPGNYTIVQTAQPAGLLDGKDSLGGVPIANSAGTDVIALTLAHTDLPNNNFGELPPPQLSGFVYHDSNNNSAKDAGEEGIAGVQINLTGTDDLGPVTKSAVTDVNGLYQFLSLRPGVYNVAEVQPTNYMDGKDTAGTRGGTVTNDLVSGIDLPAGSASVSNNFGELRPATIAGFVWVDGNNNGAKDPGEQGIGGAVINLSGLTADGPVSKQATTDGAGFYSFTNLLPGTYGINEAQPANYLDGKDSVGTQLGTLTNDQISSIALASGVNGQNNNFGELAPASLSGFVWADANNNGVKEAGENPISGINVALTGVDDAGSVSKSATTDGNGFYQFQNLRPGTYALNEGATAGYLDGKDSIGSQGGALGNDMMTNLPLTQGTSGQNNNFGELTPAGLSGFVWIDADDDGVKDTGESGITGATVTLTGADDIGSVNLSAATDSSGFYRFQNLRPGTYALSEAQPSGYNDGKDAVGSQGGTAGNDVMLNIALAAGVLGVNNNFGELNPEIADLTIVKVASAPVVKVGDNLTYTLTITNLGTFTAKDVVVTDDLPSDATFLGGSGAGWNVSQVNGKVTATRSTLAVNAPTTISITVRVPAVSNTLFNHTKVTASTPDSNPLNNDSSVTTQVVTDPPGIAPLVTKLGQLPITSKKQLISGAGSNAANKNNLAFVDGLYQTLIGRRPTKTELSAAYNRLQKKVARETIVRELWNSPAHRALQANQLYQAYLHRLPSPGEQAAMIGQLRAGAQESALAAQLLGSSEYLAAHPTPNTLAGGLYLDLTGTLPDAGVHQNLVQSMGNQSVSAAVQSLQASARARQFAADGIYRTMLHRPASSGEMQLGAQQSQSELAIKLLASAEFYSLARASVR